jgi:hypothetical protein
MDRPDQERPFTAEILKTLRPPKGRGDLGPGPPCGGNAGSWPTRPPARTGEEARTLHNEHPRKASPHPGPDPGDVATGQEKPESAQAPTRETNQRRTCARSIRKGMVG